MSLLHRVPGYVHLDGPLAIMSDMHGKMERERIETNFQAWNAADAPSPVQVVHEPDTNQYSFIAQLGDLPTMTEGGVAGKHYDFAIFPTLNLGRLLVVGFERGVEISEAEQLSAVEFQYTVPGFLLPDESDVAQFVSIVSSYQEYLADSED